MAWRRQSIALHSKGKAIRRKAEAWYELRNYAKAKHSRDGRAKARQCLGMHSEGNDYRRDAEISKGKAVYYIALY